MIQGLSHSHQSYNDDDDWNDDTDDENEAVCPSLCF